jgi:hypothetical protein
MKKVEQKLYMKSKHANNMASMRTPIATKANNGFNSTSGQDTRLNNIFNRKETYPDDVMIDLIKSLAPVVTVVTLEREQYLKNKINALNHLIKDISLINNSLANELKNIMQSNDALDVKINMIHETIKTDQPLCVELHTIDLLDIASDQERINILSSSMINPQRANSLSLDAKYEMLKSYKAKSAIFKLYSATLDDNNIAKQVSAFKSSEIEKQMVVLLTDDRWAWEAFILKKIDDDEMYCYYLDLQGRRLPEDNIIFQEIVKVTKIQAKQVISLMDMRHKIKPPYKNQGPIIIELIAQCTKEKGHVSQEDFNNLCSELKESGIVKAKRIEHGKIYNRNTQYMQSNEELSGSQSSSSNSSSEDSSFEDSDFSKVILPQKRLQPYHDGAADTAKPKRQFASPFQSEADSMMLPNTLEPKVVAGTADTARPKRQFALPFQSEADSMMLPNTLEPKVVAGAADTVKTKHQFAAPFQGAADSMMLQNTLELKVVAGAVDTAKIKRKFASPFQGTADSMMLPLASESQDSQGASGAKKSYPKFVLPDATRKRVTQQFTSQKSQSRKEEGNNQEAFLRGSDSKKEHDKHNSSSKRAPITLPNKDESELLRVMKDYSNSILAPYSKTQLRQYAESMIFTDLSKNPSMHIEGVYNKLRTQECIDLLADLRFLGADYRFVAYGSYGNDIVATKYLPYMIKYFSRLKNIPVVAGHANGNALHLMAIKLKIVGITLGHFTPIIWQDVNRNSQTMIEFLDWFMCIDNSRLRAIAHKLDQMGLELRLFCELLSSAYPLAPRAFKECFSDLEGLTKQDIVQFNQVCKSLKIKPQMLFDFLHLSSDKSFDHWHKLVNILYANKDFLLKMEADMGLQDSSLARQMLIMLQNSGQYAIENVIILLNSFYSPIWQSFIQAYSGDIKVFFSLFDADNFLLMQPIVVLMIKYQINPMPSRYQIALKNFLQQYNKIPSFQLKYPEVRDQIYQIFDIVLDKNPPHANIKGLNELFQEVIDKTVEYRRAYDFTRLDKKKNAKQLEKYEMENDYDIDSVSESEGDNDDLKQLPEQFQAENYETCSFIYSDDDSDYYGLDSSAVEEDEESVESEEGEIEEEEEDEIINTTSHPQAFHNTVSQSVPLRAPLRYGSFIIQQPDLANDDADSERNVVTHVNLEPPVGRANQSAYVIHTGFADELHDQSFLDRSMNRMASMLQDRVLGAATMMAGKNDFTLIKQIYDFLSSDSCKELMCVIAFLGGNVEFLGKVLQNSRYDAVGRLESLNEYFQRLEAMSAEHQDQPHFVTILQQQLTIIGLTLDHITMIIGKCGVDGSSKLIQFFNWALHLPANDLDIAVGKMHILGIKMDDICKILNTNDSAPIKDIINAMVELCNYFYSNSVKTFTKICNIFTDLGIDVPMIAGIFYHSGPQGLCNLTHFLSLVQENQGALLNTSKIIQQKSGGQTSFAGELIKILNGSGVNAIKNFTTILGCLQAPEWEEFIDSYNGKSNICDLLHALGQDKLSLVLPIIRIAYDYNISNANVDFVLLAVESIQKYRLLPQAAQDEKYIVECIQQDYAKYFTQKQKILPGASWPQALVHDDCSLKNALLNKRGLDAGGDNVHNNAFDYEAPLHTAPVARSASMLNDCGGNTKVLGMHARTNPSYVGASQTNYMPPPNHADFSAEQIWVQGEGNAGDRRNLGADMEAAQEEIQNCIFSSVMQHHWSEQKDCIGDSSLLEQ